MRYCAFSALGSLCASSSAHDRFFIDAQRGIFLVVDGLGGRAAGERAAEIAVDLISTRLSRRTVQVELVPELPPDVAARGFDVHYGSIPTPLPSEKVMEVRLTVITGSAEEQQLCLKRKRIHLGRLAEVIEADGRLTRKNDVAFRDDGQAPNPSVSRGHAHIEFDPEKAVFRLFDDRSAHGTTVIRDGSVISVPQGASKGVALRHGDEIVLGQARLLVEEEGGSELHSV